MVSRLFPLYEVGSLPKLPQRVKAFEGKFCSDLEIQEVQLLGHNYGVCRKSEEDEKEISHEEITTLLHRQKRKQRPLTAEEKKKMVDFNALLNLRIEEKFGLDFVYDGEARRIEMYQHVAQHIEGFEKLPEMVQSREADSWRMFVCHAEPQLKEGVLDKLVKEELAFVQAHAKTPRSVKIPIDDPFMIAGMSDNAYYARLLESAFGNSRLQSYEEKRALTLALARNIIRPQVQAAVALGAPWIQLDIPAATIDLEHIPILVEGVNAVVEGTPTEVKFSLHFCYPRRDAFLKRKGYELLFPHVLQLDHRVQHFSLELANADRYEQDLKVFAEYQKERSFAIGVGVIDITSQQQKLGRYETPQQVRERILRAAETLKDHTLVYVAPDCGMRQLKLERCIRLYEIMAEGAELARKG